MVCYFGHHYCCYVLSEELDCWLMLDDATARVMGSWCDVAHHVARERNMPALLFYEAI